MDLPATPPEQEPVTTPVAEPPEAPTEPQVITTPVAEPEHKPKQSRKRLIIMAVAAVLVIGAGVGAFFLLKKSTPKASQTAPLPPAKTTGVTWQDPQKLGDLGLFTNLTKYFGYEKDSDVQEGSKPTYYKVGSDNGNDIILASVNCAGPCGAAWAVLFLKNSDQQYSLLKLHSPDIFYQGEYQGPDLASIVKVDTTTSYATTIYQPNIVVNTVNLAGSDISSVPYSEYQDNTSTPMKHYADTNYGEVFVRTLGRGAGFEVQEFILKRPDGTAASYQNKPTFINDAYVPQVTWSDGSANTDSYRVDGIGSCGSANGLAILTTGSQDLKASGKTHDGETVYEFSNASNVTLKYFYDQYANDYEGNPRPETLSYTDYRTKHPVFAYKDSAGRYVIFSSYTYGSQGECGKPVVYLYPTKPTDVSVKVDATITKSDPAYGNGWNVKAYPSGNLVLNGKNYDSLFWEGTGHQYPSINGGFVVPQAQLISTINTQLRQLGLNDKEARDFMAFWQAKLPSTPYVRLTWFGTREMDRLAPLHVSPQPNTIIRIFLDFEGLQQSATLKPQNLSAIPRKGFTVVEWGGLLR